MPRQASEEFAKKQKVERQRVETKSGVSVGFATCFGTGARGSEG